MRRIALVSLLTLAACAGGSGGGGAPAAPGATVVREADGTFSIAFEGLSAAVGRVDPRVRVDGAWIAASDYPTVAEAASGDRRSWTLSGPGLPTMVWGARTPAGARAVEVEMTVSGAGVVEGFEPVAAEAVRVRGLRDALWFLLNGYNIFSFSGMVDLAPGERAAREPDGSVRLTGNNFDQFFSQRPQGWWWGSLGSPTAEETVVAGALTTDVWKTAVVAELAEPGRAELRVVQGTTGDRWDLARGPARSEVVHLGAAANYADAYEAYGAALRAAKPALDWPGEAPRLWSSWHQSFAEVTAEDILRNTRALAADPAYDAIEYVQLDDGYMPFWGDWYANEKFPEGMGKLAEDVAALGKTPGVWIAPTLVDARSELYAAHPDWVLRGLDDKPVQCLTCAGLFTPVTIYALDVTRPEVRAFVRDALEGFQDQGYRLFKLDFTLYAAHEARFFDPEATSLTAYNGFLETLREAARPGTFLNVVGAPILPVVGGGHATRSGDDLHFSIYADDPSHSSFVANARNFAARFFLSPGSILFDLDALYARDPLTDDEVRAMATVAALGGGMYSIGEELTTLSPARRAILVHPELIALARAGARAEPLDAYAEANPEILISAAVEHFVYRILGITRSRQPQRWSADLGGGVRYVALFNWRDFPATREVRLSELGLSSASRVRDVWREEEAEVLPGGLLRAEVPVHGVRLFRIER